MTSVQWSECLLKTSTYKLLVAGIMEVGPKISCNKAENSISSSELLARGPPYLSVCDSLVLTVAKTQVMKNTQPNDFSLI